MADEKIIQKIKKVLELSKNNPSEAKAAALKAQELLAQYHIDARDIEGLDCDIEDIDEVCVSVPAKKWKYRLANVVANNFRCKVYLNGCGTVVFYGHKTDAEVAAETFKYLFTTGDRKGNYARQHSMETAGIYNAYVFCRGVEDALSAQCTALALVVPEDVKKAYAEKSSGMRTRNVKMSRSFSDAGFNAYNEGQIDGKAAMRGKQLEG